MIANGETALVERLEDVANFFQQRTDLRDWDSNLTYSLANEFERLERRLGREFMNKWYKQRRRDAR
jgi:hypothetical protein